MASVLRKSVNKAWADPHASGSSSGFYGGSTLKTTSASKRAPKFVKGDLPY